MLKKYGISRKKYAHKLKYKNASALTKFVNDNKKKIKKSVRGFSNVANCLEVLILASESYNSIKNYSKKELLKVVATLAFKYMVAIIGEIISQVVSFILSRLIPVLVWARFIIETMLDALINWILDWPWVTTLENKFVGFVNKASIGSYFVALLQASKAVFA